MSRTTRASCFLEDDRRCRVLIPDHGPDHRQHRRPQYFRREYPDHDRHPDGVDPLTGGLADGERYPRTGGPFGYNGAFFYARVGVKF